MWKLGIKWRHWQNDYMFDGGESSWCHGLAFEFMYMAVVAYVKIKKNDTIINYKRGQSKHL